MLFITNRVPKNSDTGIGVKYDFDLNQNAPSNSIYYCERKGKNDCTEIGSKAFMEELSESNAKQLLFYIHGYSNLPEKNIFGRTEQLQECFDEMEKGLVHVVPLIWPCDNDFGIVKDYWDDQKSADMSGPSFARILKLFFDWSKSKGEGYVCTKRFNILAHSMGNRVLRGALSEWNKDEKGVPQMFRNTILMAADIVNESLEKGQQGRLISDASRNVSVYYASDDLALRGSKVANLKNKIASRRLGHSGPEDMRKVRDDVYAIDCDNFNNKYDNPKGHSYFLKDHDNKIGVVFKHMFESIKTGRVKVKDSANRRSILNENDSYLNGA